MTFAYAIGWNIDDEDLNEFDPQPASPDGVIAAVREFGGDGSLHEQGLHCTLRWDVLDGIEEYRLTLAGLDLESFLRRQVTLRLPDFEGYFHRYNGYVIRPTSPNYQFFPTNITVVANRLTRLD